MIGLLIFVAFVVVVVIVVVVGIDSDVTAVDFIDDVTVEEDNLVVDTTRDVVGNVVAIGVDSVVTADDVINGAYQVRTCAN